MTRMKKTRSPGAVVARKDKRETAEQSKERQRKAGRKGLAAGSRQNVPELKSQANEQQTPKDPRHGSKKPVALGVTNEPTAAQLQAAAAKKAAKAEQKAAAKHDIAKIEVIDEAELTPELTPEQELEQLENDDRLNGLLDQVDAGKKLNKADASWLDKRLARHQQLLEQLGLLDDEDEESEEGDDLWSRFMDAEFDPAQYEDKEDKS
ncbi:GTPase-activating protein [Oceanisphaera profunda]|uniref:Der GTPase-activating protein YihI n=1 Tax=Oceanisphaera profunda TaxID=1416627 RepID=A0A1Y0D676_9GAMM|nr:Der GTPase-activating protein YihI [Oceanisphaera profunda]ART82555.1 GTPase-activating protein [Oceanisphaera profunda]